MVDGRDDTVVRKATFAFRLAKVQAGRLHGLLGTVMICAEDPLQLSLSPVLVELREHFDDRVTPTVRDTVRLVEAPSYGLPISHYTPGPPGRGRLPRRHRRHPWLHGRGSCAADDVLEADRSAFYRSCRRSADTEPAWDASSPPTCSTTSPAQRSGDRRHDREEAPQARTGARRRA